MAPEDQRTTLKEKAMNTFTQNRKNLIAAVAAVLFGSAAVAAHADTVNDVPAVTVRYADLNLDTQAGVAALYNRIHNAAVQVCGDVDSRQLEEAVAAKACVDRAIAASVNAVQNPQLTRAYVVHGGVAPKQINVASLR
jgi:UrcA family protein